MTRTVGIEIELLCPPGATRTDLAHRLAGLVAGGSVGPDLHYDTEIALHPDIEVFHQLTPAVAVTGGDGALVAQLRDDSSIIDDLDRAADEPSGRLDGTVRIVSDDRRLLRMIGSRIDASQITAVGLARVATELGLEAERLAGGRVRLIDADGEAVAVTGVLPPERSRVAEVVSPPLPRDDVARWLDLVTFAARDIGCRAPAEGAVHLHFDALPFDRLDRLRTVVAWFDRNRNGLRSHYGTNLRCRTLGPFEPTLLVALDSDEVGQRPWAEAKDALLRLQQNQFGDVNITGLLHRSSTKPTIELRFLPVTLEPERIRAWADELGGVLTTLAVEPPTTRSALDADQLHQFLRQAAGHHSLGPRS